MRLGQLVWRKSTGPTCPPNRGLQGEREEMQNITVRDGEGERTSNIAMWCGEDSYEMATSTSTHTYLLVKGVVRVRC